MAYNTQTKTHSELFTIADEHYSQEEIPTARMPGATWYIPSTKTFYMWTNNIWAPVVPKYLQTGMKNLIINGGFDVWQRGTSYTYSANLRGYHTADRVYTQNHSDGEYVVSKTMVEYSNAIKFTVTDPNTDLTGSNCWFGYRYSFEGKDLYTIANQGKTVTLSFIFNSNVIGKYSVAFRNETDGASGVNSYVTTFDYITANQPQKITINVPLDYAFNPALRNDSNIGFDLLIGFLNQGDYATSTKNTWQNGVMLTTPDCVNWGDTKDNFVEVAELQLEEGTVATPFERRQYGEVLASCQRYYEKLRIYPNKTGDADQRCTLFYAVVKRCVPTVTITRDEDVTPQDLSLITQSTVGYVPDTVSNGTNFYITAEL